jgi:cysteine desulfurase/selenocysteine lyase
MSFNDNNNELFWHLHNDYVYLDNAASTPPFRSVMEKVLNFMRNYGSIHRGAGILSELTTQQYEEARKTMMKFVNANSERDAVVFTANTTDSINKLASMYPWNPGDKTLISDIEHSANTLPWCKVSQIEVCPTNNALEIELDALEEIIKKDNKIKVVALAGTSNITGRTIPVKEVYGICKKYGVNLFIDASQMAPHHPINMDYCDAVSFSGHKMYAPFGGGVLAARKSILSHIGQAPTGGGNVVYYTPDYEPVYQEVPRNHEIGTQNGVGAISIAAAAETLMQIGWDNIENHDKKIHEWMIKHLADIPNIKLYFPQPDCETSIAIFDTPTVSPIMVGDYLSRHRIGVRVGTFCVYRLIEKLKRLSMPHEMVKSLAISGRSLPDEYLLLRASSGLMNTEDDIIILANKLKEINNGSI